MVISPPAILEQERPEISPSNENPPYCSWCYSTQAVAAILDFNGVDGSAREYWRCPVCFSYLGVKDISIVIYRHRVSMPQTFLSPDAKGIHEKGGLIVKEIPGEAELTSSTCSQAGKREKIIKRHRRNGKWS